MVISSIKLPKNENPTEQELQNEDDNILAAFKTVYDGYRRAQERTRAIIKAYNELESIALTLLNENRQNRDVSPKKNKEKSSLSTTNADTDLIDVLMVDLTSDFDFEGSVPIANNLRTQSPIFGASEKLHKTKKFEERNFSKIGETSKSPKLEVTKSFIKIENIILNDNEENNGIVGNKNDKNVKNFAKNNDVESFSLNESRPCGRLSLARANYKIEKNKGLGGKISKQSTLVFKPHTSKVDISCSEKMKSKSSTHWANLFDDDYRLKKNSNNKQSIATEEKKDQLENVVEKKIAEPVKCIEKPEKNVECTVMDTPSQINETARSLFEDDDLDDFQISQNLLETPIADEKKSTSPNNFGKRRKIDVPIASTPKIVETSQRQESIDETFFAPGELNPIKNFVKQIDKKMPVAGCSKMLTPKKADDKSRESKQKTNEKLLKNNEIDDLDLIDSDWDTDISNEICSPIKQRLDNSFDIVPGKMKKSPEYAYKSKTERNKDKRSKLPGWDCWECEKYYSTMNLPPAELKKRMNSCSRHKFKYNQRYYTPKDFWNPEFPDTLDSSDWSDNDRPTKKN